MNIKVSEKSVVFKITEEELRELIDRKVMEKSLPRFGRKNFAMVIDASESFENMMLDIVLDKFEACFMLSVPQQKLYELAEMGKSREGLLSSWNGIDFSLQVDVRSDTRPRHNKL